MTAEASNGRPTVNAPEPIRLREKITPRLYQQRIFMKCIANDTLLVLPTGLGKTLVAIMVAIQRLNLHEGSKIVFLAPTKPLVMQHQETLQDLITIDPDQIIVLTGYASVEKGVQAMKLGAMEFLKKPAEVQDLVDQIQRAKAKKMVLVEKRIEEKVQDILERQGW